MLKNRSRLENSGQASVVPAWRDHRPIDSDIGVVFAEGISSQISEEMFSRFGLRVFAVGAPILVIFSLPGLGVYPGVSFSLLAFLLLAWPLFVFDCDEERDAMRRAYCHARREEELR